MSCSPRSGHGTLSGTTNGIRPWRTQQRSPYPGNRLCKQITIQLYCQVSIQLHDKCFVVPGTLISHSLQSLKKIIKLQQQINIQVKGHSQINHEKSHCHQTAYNKTATSRGPPLKNYWPNKSITYNNLINKPCWPTLLATITLFHSIHDPDPSKIPRTKSIPAWTPLTWGNFLGEKVQRMGNLQKKNPERKRSWTWKRSREGRTS